MVIFNHTNERGFYKYALSEPSGLSWTIKWFCSMTCKSAVPIFFMISGSLLINRNESISRTYKRTLIIVIDLIIFSFIYTLLPPLFLVNGEYSFKSAIKFIISNYYWHLWYLYAYIAFIFTLPILRDFCKSITKKSFIILYTISVLLIFVAPIFEYFFIKVNIDLKPSWISCNIFIYPIIGYVIEKNLIPLNKKVLLIAWCINIFSFLVSYVAEIYFLTLEPGNGSETFLRITMIINAPVIFMTAKYLSDHKIIKKKLANQALHVIISQIGKCTYGIYLLHGLFLCKISSLTNIWTHIENTMPYGTGICVTVIMVFAISGILTWLLKKIPIVKLLF